VADLTPFDGTAHQRSRHLVGRATIRTVVDHRGPDGWRAVVEPVRSLIVRGAPGGDAGVRGLYLGLVIGDDRTQDVVQRARFRTAGLTHLLAVSGQNVAFVLAAAGPIVLRLGRRARWVAVAAILVGFAVITRFEPSVVRATWTAAVAIWAAWTGRRSTGLVSIAAAVSLELVIDPALRLSLGFRLSVAATLGIVVLGPVLAARWPGPVWLRFPAAVTTAAQLAVLPFLERAFGPVSLASLPANLLAGPAAGFVMTWGMTAGPVLALVGAGEGSRSPVDLPVRWALRWLDLVAASMAALPLPRVGVGVVALATMTWIAATLALGARRGQALVGVVTLTLLASTALDGDRRGHHTTHTLAEGAEVVWLRGSDHAEWGALVLDRPHLETVVEAALDARIRGIEVVVARHGGRTTRDVVAALRDVVDVGVVLAPRQHRIPGADAVRERVVIGEGWPRLVLTPSGGDELLVGLEVCCCDGADVGPEAQTDTALWGISPGC